MGCQAQVTCHLLSLQLLLLGREDSAPFSPADGLLHLEAAGLQASQAEALSLLRQLIARGRYLCRLLSRRVTQPEHRLHSSTLLMQAGLADKRPRLMPQPDPPVQFHLHTSKERTLRQSQLRLQSQQLWLHSDRPSGRAYQDNSSGPS